MKQWLFAQVLAIPTFAYGGRWTATTFLEEVQLREIQAFYFASFAFTFAIPIIYLMIRTVIATGNSIALKDERKGGKS